MMALAALSAQAITMLPATTLADSVARARLVATFGNDPPVSVTSPAGEKHLLFVVSQTGKVWVLDDEVKETTPFLDISGRVLLGAERGMFSIAFAPDYAMSRYFYVAYTNKRGDIQIDEFRRKADNPKRADHSTRRLVLSVLHRDGTTHNGGQLQFGPDGYLYISIGDGGSLSSPKGSAARDLTKLLGKILRISPRPSGTQAYTIPPDNPYVGISNRKPEIFAYGLRNSWRFSFHGGLMAIADEGEDRQDEINILPTQHVKGTNFGWPKFEGKLVNPNGVSGPDPAKMPMYVHNHDNGHCAVIGGYFVRDPDLPELKGRYIFGDLCGGRIMSMIPDVPNQRPTSLAAVGPIADQLTSFGVGPNGAIYYTQFGGSELWRIVPPRRKNDETASE